MKPLLIFDYDGVIINSREAWFSSFLEIMKKTGNEVTVEEFLPHLGLKTEKVIENLLPEDKKHLSGEIKEIVDEYVSTKGLEKATLCPNAKEVLENLNKENYNIVLLTNSDAMFTYAGLKKFGIADGIWDLVVTADDPFEKKENAIEFILACFNCRKEDAFYIADKARDVKIARYSGVKSVIVSNEYAWDTEKQVRAENPDFLISDLKELKSLLKGQ